MLPLFIFAAIYPKPYKTMLEVNFSPCPVLTTERLILRQTVMSDAPEVFFLRSDPEMTKYSGRAPITSMDEATAFIQKITDALDQNEGIAWAICLKDDPKMIGSLGIWRLIKEHYRAELGYTLNTAYQGKGLMHEAMTAIIDYGFRVMKLHSLEANITPLNKASQRVLERCNFVREAYYRENYYEHGKFTDSAIYSLLTPYR